MSTLIKRLKQDGQQFVPVTLAEAVVVNTNGSLGITTLDKVLGQTNVAISQINNAVSTALSTKQDKLTAGYGINIADDGTISVTSSQTIFQVATQLPTPSINTMNVIYIIPIESEDDTNKCAEYICINEKGVYRWEQFGTIRTDVGLAGCITAESMKTSSGESIYIDYDIPSDLYDDAITL